MVQTRYPNRWFGSNPQAISNHGKRLHPFNRELPKDWRSALEIDGTAGAKAQEGSAEGESED